MESYLCPNLCRGVRHGKKDGLFAGYLGPRVNPSPLNNMAMTCTQIFSSCSTPHFILKLPSMYRLFCFSWLLCLFSRVAYVLYTNSFVIFTLTACAFIGYFEVTWLPTIKLFPAKFFLAGGMAPPMTSELRATVQYYPLATHWDLLSYICKRRSFSSWLCATNYLVDFVSRETRYSLRRIKCFPRTSHNSALQQRHYYVTHVNRKWGLFPSNMPWRCQSCLTKCLYSYWDYLPEKFCKIASQDCKTSTSGWRAWLKNVRASALQ